MTSINDIMGNLNALSNVSPLPDPNEPYRAKWMYERVVKKITEFEESIPDNMQAGGRFVSSANGYTFSIDDVGYWNPDMIVFYGTGPDGAKVELLQHTSQLNLLLVAVPRTDDLSKPRRKIGFVPEESEP